MERAGMLRDVSINRSLDGLDISWQLGSNLVWQSLSKITICIKICWQGDSRICALSHCAAAEPPRGTAGSNAASYSLQTIAVKALGTPHVFVEALDPDGNKVVEKVESEVSLQSSGFP